MLCLVLGLNVFEEVIVEKLLDYQQVADHLGITVAGVRKLVSRGRIPIVKITNGIVRIKEADLVRLMNESTVTKGGEG